ncbi:MAG: fasciclin domain-containing protein [Chloroflexi bacterium]|nr:fasciclin domain-containing protein [Chloroflexota bacterium]
MKTVIGKFVMALLIVAFAVGAFAPAASAASPERKKKGNTIVDVALAENARSGEFSILIAALQAADPIVLRTLSGKGQFTVFAPTDAAFASLLDELGLTAEQLLSNKKLVTNVLIYHVALGKFNSGKVLASSQIKMADGRYLSQSGGVLTDENGRTANIVAVDIKASNGFIHVIDKVVLPKNPASGNTIVDVAVAENAKSGEFSILIAALQAADPIVLQLLSGWGQFTVFAPTDAAFVSLLGELGMTADELLANKALVTNVLLYHVAYGNLDSSKVLASSQIQMSDGRYLSQSGGVLTDENGRASNIVAVDIQAINGYIHVIDRVVLPKNPTSANTIVDIALAENAKSGEFSILIAALQAADPVVLQALSGKGQFTVFAPTDAAFLALLDELGMTAEELLGNKELVTKVLAYHVALGFLDSSKVLASSSIKMSDGGTISQNGGVLTDANGRTANIVAVDIKASNGYIHIIDRVVLP